MPFLSKQYVRQLDTLYEWRECIREELFCLESWLADTGRELEPGRIPVGGPMDRMRQADSSLYLLTESAAWACVSHYPQIDIKPLFDLFEIIFTAHHSGSAEHVPPIENIHILADRTMVVVQVVECAIRKLATDRPPNDAATSTREEWTVNEDRSVVSWHNTALDISKGNAFRILSLLIKKTFVSYTELDQTTRPGGLADSIKLTSAPADLKSYVSRINHAINKTGCPFTIIADRHRHGYCLKDARNQPSQP